MEEPDAFVDAAFIHIALPCYGEGCLEILESECLTDGPRYPDDGWEVALATEAKRLGWRVEVTPREYKILCPRCAALPDY